MNEGRGSVGEQNRAAQPGAWIESPAHQAWLDAERDRLLDFGVRSEVAGGFGWQGATGAVDPAHPLELWITCRMTHVYALASLLGRPGAGDLADHGVTAISNSFLDRDYDGWFTSIAADGAGAPIADAKAAYPHAFVVLAASSATSAGRPGAQHLLDGALEVHERRF